MSHLPRVYIFPLLQSMHILWHDLGVGPPIADVSWDRSVHPPWLMSNRQKSAMSCTPFHPPNTYTWSELIFFANYTYNFVMSVKGCCFKLLSMMNILKVNWFYLFKISNISTKNYCILIKF